MITLNLLDKKRKKEYLAWRLLLTVQKGIEIFFCFVLFLGIIFSVAQYYLQKNFEVVAEQMAFINKSVGNFNQEINQINSQLKKIDEIQKGYISWSPLLIEITNTIPEGIKIDSWSINKKDSIMRISGLAKTRDNFLIFKTNLESIYFITKVESPLPNLLKKENVDFEITVTTDLNRL